MRSSQRATKACIFCRGRKIKCDKRFPCRECRDRGIGGSCRAEAVIVKGRINRFVQLETRNMLQEPDRSRYQPETQSPQRTYQDLLEENARLRSVQQHRGPSRHVGAGDSLAFEPAVRMLLDYIKSSSRTRTVEHFSDIVFPPEQLSRDLVDHGFEWTAWLHCSISPSEFSKQHEDYLHKLRLYPASQAADYSWLALYFAHITASSYITTVCPDIAQAD